MSLFTDVLPLALGAAVSPALLTLQVLVLTGKHSPRVRGWAVVVGSGAVVMVYLVVGLTVLRQLPDHDSGTTSPAMAWGKIVCGVLLLLLGVRELLPARTTGEAARQRSAARAERMADAKPRLYVGLGAVGMLTNFSSLVLFFPALHEISASSDPIPLEIAVGIFLVLMMLVPVLVPVLLVTVMGARSDAVLAAMNRFATAHQRQINAGICFVFAALLLWSGVKGLR